MEQRSPARFWNLLRNAVTLLLLGLLGIEVTIVLDLYSIQVIVSGLPAWPLLLFGWLLVGVGVLLLVGGLQRMEVRKWVVGLDDLMTSGPFRYVRRPVYGGVLLVLVGAGLLLDLPGLLVTGVLWSGVAMVYSRIEDRGIRDRLGQGYKSYCRCTPLLLPHLGRMMVDLFRAQ